MKSLLDSIVEFWKSKIWIKGQKSYVFVLLFFIVWMLFFDKNRVSTHIKINKTISSMEQSIDHYNRETENLLKERRDLDKNKERYAREKFLMHKENEEVFVLQNKLK